MIETERLRLREYTPDDFDALYEILSDPETMQHYPAPFDEEKTRNWIRWNLDNYAQYGFGLWAVVLKETGEFIGDCGITIQNIDGELLPEIGYHIHKKYWRRGFAKEAARAVRDWAFRNTAYDTLYSYMKYTNIGSYSTALANGMKKVKEYPDPKNTISCAYAITRGEWEALMAEKEAGPALQVNRERRLTMEYTIRKITIDDYDEIFALWNATEQSRRALNPVDDSREGIGRYLKRNPDTCFAAVADNRIVGVILTGHDGRRGIIHHMCVHPDFRRMGIAARLVSVAEDALKKEGIQKVFGLVFVNNDAANLFWEKQGYSLRTNLNYRNKSLNEKIPAGE